MTITFENDNDVIVYASEKDISFARNSPQIFVAQCVWWLASIIGLEQGLTNYIDNLHSRVEVTIDSEELPDTTDSTPKDQSDIHQDKMLKDCEEI
jgi:hypothetical protein